MFSNNETRILEIGLFAAVPICVAIAALVALFTLAQPQGVRDRNPLMNHILFLTADFLSRPPGFYVMVVAMVLCTALVPFGLTNAVT